LNELQLLITFLGTSMNTEHTQDSCNNTTPPSSQFIT